MAGAIDYEPNWVSAILEWRWTWPIVRLALVSSYLVGGVTKLFDFHSAALEQEHFGLHPGWLWATLSIIVELCGSALVILRSAVWLGAGGLGVLTVVAIVVSDDFWNMGGTARFAAMNGFFEHVGLIAGLVLVAVFADRDLHTRDI